MELHYYKNIEEPECGGYLTWEFLMVNHYHNGDLIATVEKGWTKKDIPKFISSQEKEAAHWFSISNMEDEHFLHQEQIYCNIFIQKELTEIARAEINNKMILNSN